MNSTLHHKLKQAAIQRFILETPSPSVSQWVSFGKALDRRFKLLDGLLVAVKRGKLSEQELINRLGGLIIIRQTEEDLALYQDQLEALTTQLQEGEITESEFEERLAAMAAAVLLLMYFLGSQSGNEEQLAELRLTLETGGEVEPDLDLSDLPDEAASQLEAAFEIAGTSAAGLGLDIITGEYADNQEALASRLVMWLGTAAGIYALGQLFRGDSVRYMWAYGPTDHCKDCRGLNGQVHTAAEWRAFYIRTGKKPQGHGLECGGWLCLCGLYETTEPISGNFV